MVRTRSVLTPQSAELLKLRNEPRRKLPGFCFKLNAFAKLLWRFSRRRPKKAIRCGVENFVSLPNNGASGPVGSYVNAGLGTWV